MKDSIASLSLALLIAAPALATDHIVSPPVGIQAAIDVSLDGDRILAQPGTYFERIDFQGKSIEIIGVQGAANTLLDGESAGAVVTFARGEGPSSVLRGFTVTHGSNGVLSVDATPRIEDCVITGNHGSYGAGVHGDPTLVRCTISYNSSSLAHGGGVWGAPDLFECVVENNTCTHAFGGGLYLVGGTSTVRDSVIVGNAAVLTARKGGGIYVDSTATATIERCVIARNYVVAGNFGAYGGGIFVESPGSTLDHCTVVGNLLSGSSEVGGGLYGPLAVTGSIFRGNDAGEIALAASVTFTDVEGGHPGAGNIDAPPLFWDETANDFHLRPGSPCIDAGDPNGAPDPDGSVPDMGVFPFDPAYPNVPEFYCISAPNSTGQGAHMGYSGSVSIALNDFVLRATDCPPLQNGLFFYGATQTQVPAGAGYVCIGAPLFRLPVVQTGTDGAVSHALDVTAPPYAGGEIVAGSSWNFQFWYRDVPSGFNFSDGMSVAFVD